MKILTSGVVNPASGFLSPIVDALRGHHAMSHHPVKADQEKSMRNNGLSGSTVTLASSRAAPSSVSTERATPTRHQAEEAIATGQSSIDPENVAQAAYFRAERRGFAPGQEMDDWLAAERELQNAPDSEDVSSS